MADITARQKTIFEAAARVLEIITRLSAKEEISYDSYCNLRDIFNQLGVMVADFPAEKTEETRSIKSS